MRVRYSNRIKEIVPWEILQECVQLTYSVIPTEGIHIFQFEQDARGFRIRHNALQIRFEREIVHQRGISSNTIDDVAIYRNRECIYVLTLDELLTIKL